MWGLLVKAQVRGYQRKDGSFVRPHTKAVRPAKSAPSKSAIGAHADAFANFVARYRDAHGEDDDYWQFKIALDDMKAGNHAQLARTLKSADTWQREMILNHIHPDQWEPVLGIQPLNKERSIKEHQRRFGLQPE